MSVGFLSVSTHPRESRVARVTVDDVDVTRRCFAADDERGFADCFALDAQGRKYIDPSDRSRVATERLHGQVVIEFPNGLD